MIFVTVGSMLPFDRLIERMDEWAARNPGVDIFAQIGEGRYEPRHMPWARMIDRPEFLRRMCESRFVVSHAGIGTIFTALENGTPIIILPRRAAWREHTNDHQLHTAARLEGRSGLWLAMTDADLMRLLEAPPGKSPGSATLSPTAPPEFIARIRSYLLNPA